MSSNDKGIANTRISSDESGKGGSQLTRARYFMKIPYHDLVFVFLRMLIEKGCLSHDPKMGTFTVKGSSDKPYVVRLYPKEYCSCPATSLCYHVIAVRLSLGMEISQETKRVNLSQLKRNTRTKVYKKSGRKRPSPGITLNLKFLH